MGVVVFSYGAPTSTKVRAKGFEKALQETNKNAKNAKTASEQKEVGWFGLV